MQAPPEAVAELAPQVRANCLRSDAAVAGRFSLCGLLLRLRNLYKWENGLPPWREGDSGEVLDWVSRREEQWDALPGLSPLPYRLDGLELDPFDQEGVNRLLRPLGWEYGAGWVSQDLPVFFLGRLAGQRRRDGLEVLELDRELGRDIYFLPGMRQGKRVYLRRDPLAFLLWDKIADPRKSAARFVAFGLAGYGVDRAGLLAAPGTEALAPVLAGEMEAVLWHEAGEAAAGPEAGALLERAINDHPASELEHFMRGVKDLLADTVPGGRLAGIIAGASAGALGFFPAWLAGFPRLLFPEIDAAVMEFMAGGDWGTVEQARELGHRRALRAIELLGPIMDMGPGEATLQAARREVIGPLTGDRPLPDE